MAVNEAIIDKIAKLLALAGNNPNEHEAALAASKAQAMMQEYDLAMGDVESFKVDKRTGGVVEADRVTLRKKGKPGGWKVALFNAVGKTSDCWVYANDASRWYDGQGRFIGRKIDVEMAGYVFEFLVRELERLQDEYGKTRWAELKQFAKRHEMSTHEAEREFSAMRRHPLKAKQSWIEGAAEQVISNLHKAKRERDNNPDANALVVNKDAAIRDWWAQQQGYVDYADYLAKRTPLVVTNAKVKRLTQREIDRMVRAAQREQARQDRAEARKWANRDRQAYGDGMEAGARLAVRPGVRAGDAPKEVRHIDG